MSAGVGQIHASLTGANLHEPKGVSTATAGEVYHADGAGSGAWYTPVVYLQQGIQDGSAAGSYWLPSPVAGLVTKAIITVDKAFSADQDIVLEIGGVAVTNGTISLLTAGSAAGSTFTATPTALNSIGANQPIEVVNPGGSAAAFIASVIIEVTPQ